MKLNSLLLIMIFVLGLSLRLFDLAKLPAILNRDEAALAYNAFLINETKLDEWGSKLPLVFKSFGDYKLPGYIYLLSVLFKFLPTSDFVVRLPSALAGSLLIILAFYFGRDILKLKKETSLFMALFVALNPVFFFYSRIAFEANLALFLFVLALFFLLRAKKRNLFLASLFFFLAILTYNTPFLLLPFVILLLPYRIGFKKINKWIMPTFLLIIIFIWGLVNFYSLTAQKSGITIFNDQGLWQEFATQRSQLPNHLQTILGNKYLFYGKIILKNLLASFSLNFLVTNGGSHPWHSLPGSGHIFYIIYLLAIFTLIDLVGELIFRDKKISFKKDHLVFLYLTIAALAPSVVTVDSPHATRSLFFFFMLICLAAMFIDKLVDIFTKHKKLIYSSVLLIMVIESSFYYYKYFTRYQYKQPQSLFVNYPTLLREAENNYKGQQIAVIDEGGYQYILTAWYLKLASADFFATMKYQQANQINFYYGEQLMNYHFVKKLPDRKQNENIVLSQELGLIKYE